MNTFFRNAEYTNGPSIMVIRTTNGEIFGGFASEPWKKRLPHEGFYGTGECFLFSLYPRAEVHQWTGANVFCMYSTGDEIAMGGGRSKKMTVEKEFESSVSVHFGIWLDSEFLVGYSHPCGTFENPQLAEKEQFETIFVEFWGIQSYGEEDQLEDDLHLH